jgi:hypothetical protein
LKVFDDSASESPHDVDVEFHAAGQHAKGEYHCAECGYGVTVFRELPRCPMCGCEAWEQSTWSPFARARSVLH